MLVLVGLREVLHVLDCVLLMNMLPVVHGYLMSDRKVLHLSELVLVVVDLVSEALCLQVLVILVEMLHADVMIQQ